MCMLSYNGMISLEYRIHENTMMHDHIHPEKTGTGKGGGFSLAPIFQDQMLRMKTATKAR